MQQNLGRVKGSMWYAGTAITGTSTTPTAYATGITYALEQDLYLNTETGNVYSCDTEGSQSNALWVYIANIMGPVGDIVDNLHTDNGTKALSARQGKVLNEKLLSSGVYPKSVDFDIETAVYIAEITIQNIDGTITLRSADDSGSEEFTKIGTSDTYTVSVDIDSSTGFSTTGAILNNISFTGNIYSVVLKDSNADTILSQTFNVWESLNEALGIIKPSGAITDGSETLKTGKMYKDIEGTTTQIYPITHAKGVWYDKANNVTVKNAIDGKATKAEATTNLAPIESTNIASQSYTVGSYLVYNGLLYKVTAPIAQGATLQEGVNIQQTKVGNELEEINSFDYINSTSRGMNLIAQTGGWDIYKFDQVTATVAQEKINNIIAMLNGYKKLYVELYNSTNYSCQIGSFEVSKIVKGLQKIIDMITSSSFASAGNSMYVGAIQEFLYAKNTSITTYPLFDFQFYQSKYTMHICGGVSANTYKIYAK